MICFKILNQRGGGEKYKQTTSMQNKNSGVISRNTPVTDKHISSTFACVKNPPTSILFQEPSVSSRIDHLRSFRSHDIIKILPAGKEPAKFTSEFDANTTVLLRISTFPASALVNDLNTSKT